MQPLTEVNLTREEYYGRAGAGRVGMAGDLALPNQRTVGQFNTMS